MIPTTVTLRNFRSFALPDGAALELRPLTLLYGLNNGGKSSLLRSLPLLADSLGYDGLDALNVEGRLKPFDLDFDSLRWKGRAETDEHTIQVSLRWDDGLEVEWTLWEQPDWHRIVVKSFTVRGQGAAAPVQATWVMTRGEDTSPVLTYDVRHEGGEVTRQGLGFHGLLPANELTLLGPLLGPCIKALRPRLHDFGGSVLWLRSLREAPARKTRWRGAVRWSLEPDGRDAPILLVGEDDVRAEVSSWYRKQVGFDLVVEESGKREVRALLRKVQRASFDVDLIDTGEGLSQCLPVLTALAMARRHRERGRPAILALEEPEAHLHPDLQRALAERACEVAADTRPRIVMETHSEHILLAVRLQVVKRLLRPEDVVVYWVRQREDGSSVADRIELTTDGRFAGNWPPDAFQQDIALTTDILDALDGRAAS